MKTQDEEKHEGKVKKGCPESVERRNVEEDKQEISEFS